MNNGGRLDFDFGQSGNQDFSRFANSTTTPMRMTNQFNSDYSRQTTNASQNNANNQIPGTSRVKLSSSIKTFESAQTQNNISTDQIALN